METKEQARARKDHQEFRFFELLNRIATALEKIAEPPKRSGRLVKHDGSIDPPPEVSVFGEK